MGGRKPKEYTELGKESPKAAIVKKSIGEKKKEVKKVPKAVKEPVETPKAPVHKKPVKKRSARYLEKLKLVDKKREYPVSEAIKIVKQLSMSGFEGGVEVHIRLKLGKKGEEEQLRGKVVFPSGQIKPQKVVVATPEAIKEIERDKLDFDILLARPENLSDLAKVAKFLGPKGKMPSVKSQTVVKDPEKTLQDIQKGLTFWKADTQGNIHLLIGKTGWSDEKILENLKAFLQVLPKNKILSFYLAPSIGPSVKVNLDSI